MKQIKIKIDPVGRSTVDAVGFMGGSCKDATKNILAALGAGDPAKVKVEDKPEIHMVDTNTEQDMLTDY
jgi:hypothetical protein